MTNCIGRNVQFDSEFLKFNDTPSTANVLHLSINAWKERNTQNSSCLSTVEPRYKEVGYNKTLL